MVDKSRCKKLSLIALETGRRQIMLTVKDMMICLARSIGTWCASCHTRGEAGGTGWVEGKV